MTEGSPPARGRQYEKHAFVCVKGRACPHQGALELFGALRSRAKERGLVNRIRINKSGCLGQCGYGPMVVVYPEETWYAAVRPEDAERILTEHLEGGTPVEDLLHHPPGPGIQICDPGRETIPIVVDPDAASDA